MGRKDTILKDFVQRNDVFADLCNAFIFGKKMISFADLQEQDGSADTGRTSMQRDVEKLCTVKEHLPVRMMIGIENQNYIDYAIPVRIAQYDFADYGKQMRSYFRSRRKELKGRKVRNYPQEVTKGCVLIPVQTLVLYWGEGEWDGPLSLRGVMDDNHMQDQLCECNDYHVHLVCMRNLAKKQMDLIDTEDLKDVLDFLQAADHPEKMKQKLADGYFRAISDEAVDVISVLTDISIKKEEGRNNNMCYAIDVIKKEYAAEQVAIARAEAEEEKKEAMAEVERTTEKKLIAGSFERMKENDPSLKDSEIIRFLAQIFGKSEKTIRRWVRNHNCYDMQTR